jgi:NTE family protein
MTECAPQILPRLARREFLAFGAAALLLGLTGCGRPRAPRVGLALGGGGARGLAHIPMLETLDARGVVPHVVAGCSIGAIIGALYASGMSGRKIRAQVEQFFVDRKDAGGKLFTLPKSIRWLDFIDPTLAGGGLLSSDDFIRFLGEIMSARHFHELKIPLRIVAADLATGAPVVLESGELLPAIQASMAVPGVFPPVHLHGRLLVDGGVADPLPYDLVETGSDIVIAIDVSGRPDIGDGSDLTSLGVLLQSFHTMSNNLLAEMLKQRRPDILVQPDIHDVRILEFYKAQQVFEQAAPAQRRFKAELDRALHRSAVLPGCSVRATPAGAR